MDEMMIILVPTWLTCHMYEPLRKKNSLHLLANIATKSHIYTGQRELGLQTDRIKIQSIPQSGVVWHMYTKWQVKKTLEACSIALEETSSSSQHGVFLTLVSFLPILFGQKAGRNGFCLPTWNGMDSALNVDRQAKSISGKHNPF